MIMSEGEILRDYRLAKSPQKQIIILADANCCHTRDIVKILLANGEKVPGNFLPKKDKAAAKEPKPDAVEAVAKLDRAQKPVPAISRQEYTDVLFWLAYGAGACLAIEDKELQEKIVRCFETAHELLKELSA